TGPGRLSAEATAELPERLLDAAMTLFVTQGYGKTSMEKIARAAGASTKTVYSRFADKAEVARAVVKRLADRVTSGHAAPTALAPGQSEPRVFLLSFASFIAASITEEAAGLNRLAMSEALRFPELAQLYGQVIERGCGIVSNALTTWERQGLLSLHGADAKTL